MEKKYAVDFMTKDGILIESHVEEDQAAKGERLGAYSAAADKLNGKEDSSND